MTETKWDSFPVDIATCPRYFQVRRGHIVRPRPNTLSSRNLRRRKGDVKGVVTEVIGMKSYGFADNLGWLLKVK